MKEFQYGNSTIVIHSPLVHMTPQEQQQWYKEEWKKENPILKAIVEAAAGCHHDIEEE